MIRKPFMNIHIYNHSYHEVTSGGDAISAEFGRAWTKAKNNVHVFTNIDAHAFFLSRNIAPHAIHVASYIPLQLPNVLWASFFHLINGVLQSIFSSSSAPDIIFAT